MSPCELPSLTLLLMLSSIACETPPLTTMATVAPSLKSAIDRDACDERLERALDTLHKDSSDRRNRLEEGDRGAATFRQELHSAPLTMTVSRIAVKVSQNGGKSGRDLNPWTRVKKCVYEPTDNSLETRVLFDELSVSGTVTLLPRDPRSAILMESCKMNLRLRDAGVDIFTRPIARGRGQMRVRTESSFLEPRFASVYTYGCRVARHDRSQRIKIERQDKWPSRPYPFRDEMQSFATNNQYEAAEPREFFARFFATGSNTENENRHSRDAARAAPRKYGIWRKNTWLTKTPLERKRRTSDEHENSGNSLNVTSSECFSANQTNSNECESVLRESRETVANIEDEEEFAAMLDDASRSWQSKENVAREMEDNFLKSASQSLTSYIERRLHPAIKETLMLSMGYTISYG